MKWTLVLMVSALLGFMPLSQPSWGAGDSMERVLKKYVQIQESLAADTLGGVQTAGQEILANTKSLNDKNLSRAIESGAKKLAGAKDIAAARSAFKELSKPIVGWAQKAKPSGFEVVDCSMAGANWVQKKGTIQNPYYGKEMLECGEKVS